MRGPEQGLLCFSVLLVCTQLALLQFFLMLASAQFALFCCLEAWPPCSIFVVKYAWALGYDKGVGWRLLGG